MRSNIHRTRKYDKKIRAMILPGQKSRFGSAVTEQVKIEEEIKALLGTDTGTSTIFSPFYMAFAKTLSKLKQKHADEVFEVEACIEFNKCLCRGLRLDLLVSILNIFMGKCITKVIITNGTDDATVTPDGFLDVKSHTPEKCFTQDYADAQTDAVIITPAAGKKIEIVSVYASVGTNATNVTLKFADSGRIVFKVYTEKKSDATGNQICARGDTDEQITLTCPMNTFVSIGYDELD